MSRGEFTSNENKMSCWERERPRKRMKA
jgi:hypothetical protein